MCWDIKLNIHGVIWASWVHQIYCDIYFVLPSAFDILRYILCCRAIAIYDLPINLRYIYKRVSPLVLVHMIFIVRRRTEMGVKSVLNNALWIKLLRKWEIGKFNKITSSPLIFWKLYYFRWKIFAVGVWSVSLSIYICVRVELDKLDRVSPCFPQVAPSDENKHLGTSWPLALKQSFKYLEREKQNANIFRF